MTPQDVDGKYRLGRVLQQGDRALIVAATHLALREPVVVKVLNADERDPRYAARLKRAARQSASLRSAHVVRYLDVGHLADQRPYVVMERLSGETVAERIAKGGPLSVRQVVDVVLQTCEALACAHVRGIIHRDLRTSNIFCTEQPGDRIMIKVLNFGTSRAVDSSGAQEDQGMTVSALVVDDPEYKAPEQLVPRSKTDVRTDTWALGAMMYEMLTGTRAFAAPSTQETIRRILSAELSPSPAIPPELWTVIRSCISLRREDRCESVATIAEAIAHLADPSMSGYPARIRQILETPVADEPQGTDADDPNPPISNQLPPVSAGAPTASPAGLAGPTLVDRTSFDAPATLVAQADPKLPRLDDGHMKRRSLPFLRVSQLGDLNRWQRKAKRDRFARILLWGAALAAVLVFLALAPRLIVGTKSAPAASERNAAELRASAPTPAPTTEKNSPPAAAANAPSGSQEQQPGAKDKAANSATTGDSASARAPRPASTVTAAPNRNSPSTASSTRTTKGDDPWGWER